MGNREWAPTLPLQAIISFAVMEIAPNGRELGLAPLRGWADEANIGEARKHRPDVTWSSTEHPQAFVNLETGDVHCEIGFTPVIGINYRFTSAGN